MLEFARIFIEIESFVRIKQKNIAVQVMFYAKNITTISKNKFNIIY